MGIFDFLKNKKDNSKKIEATKSELPKSEFFHSINKYSEYIVSFIGMQTQGNYAPISAFEKPNGEIVGFLYVMGKDNSYSLSAEEVIVKMEERFEKQLANKEILSYSILYHSQFDNNENHKIANSDEELKAISISYNFEKIEKGQIGLPYHFEGDEVKFKGFNKLTPEENNLIFNTKTIVGKNYFQEREEIVPPSFENEFGIKIKKANSQDLSNTWCGIFGFETYRKPNGGRILQEYFALAMTKVPRLINNNLSISEIEFQDVNFKTITQNEKPITILPVVKTNYKLDFETKEIVEWENVDNLEAIVSGKGRDTFGLWFFATDYAENKEKYQTQKMIDLNLSGIAFVLDIHKEDKSGELKYSKDFTMYMPNNDLPNYACFDFIGQLEDFKESNLLEDKSVKGYLLNVKLITNEEIKDFFSIDIFVTKENMRFSELQKGMKLTGMFQLQGRIAE